MDYKYMLLKAYCFVYMHKNFGVGLDKNIKFEKFEFEEKDEQFKCSIFARMQAGVAITYKNIIVSVKEYELENFLTSIVNHYIY